jgi:transketolase
MATSSSAVTSPHQLDTLCIDTLRLLAVDAVEKANSGHPGLPLDAAPMAYVLWTRLLRFNPANPNWFDRDRFLLSAGHGSMLLYGLLYLSGYDLPLEEIQRFRQWGSKTPGHPERGLTPGVEVTTGPLGQGFGNAVGMAIAEAYLAARYNRPGFEIINHYTYTLASDGDLMEGVGSEAASLAGHLKLGKLITLYDNNRVTLAASADLTFTEDVASRFAAYGWHTQSIDDGNDLGAIEAALRAARQETSRPSLILVRTHIGYGSPHKQDTFEAHGSPLGKDEVRATKENLGWPTEPPFHVPPEALEHFREAIEHGRTWESAWQQRMDGYAKAFPDLARELQDLIEGRLPEGWDADIPTFPGDAKPMATRVAGGQVMNAIAPRLPGLIGGSADLDPSTFTVLNGQGDFESPDRAAADRQGTTTGPWSYAGRNLHFGVREHAMGSILNGMAAHGGTIPYGATFLIFSDYMRPPIRLACLSGLHVLFIFTHDSIGLGEDGPTHQPVEQLLGLRSVPELIVFRPADANETAAAWRVAVGRVDDALALVLSRQKLPVLDPQRHPGIREGVQAGGYVLAESADSHPRAVLIATGSEVHLALAAQERLQKEGIGVRVVSMPSWNLFDRQPRGYQDDVLPPDVPKLAIEAGTPLGWRPYVGPAIEVIGVDRFGASAPGEVVMEHYGLNVNNVCRRVMTMLRGPVEGS